MLLTILLLLFSISPIHADDFNAGGDGVFNEYYQTIGLTVQSFPDNSEEVNSISYDLSKTGGVLTELSQGKNIQNLTALGYMRKIPDILDEVKGPPETKVDILYYFFNDAKHTVNISKLAIPFSRSVPDMGDLTNILEFQNDEPSFKSIDVLFNGYNLRKEGKLKEYLRSDEVENGLKGSFVIDSVEISNPISIESIELEKNEEMIDVKILLKNNSSEKLNNILFVHDTYSLQFDSLSFEERTIEYSLDNTDDLGYFKITNPNTKTECSVYGSNFYNWLQPNAVTVLAYREDGGWVNGAHVQPVQESFCITRIPYSMTSSLLVYENIPDDDNIVKENIDIGKENLDMEEVLGIQHDDEELLILPKTAKRYYEY